MSILSTLFCVVLLGISSIHAHVASPFRHLTGITLDRVIDVTKAPPTEPPTPSPTPKPKKTFVIDVDDVHGHVTPTTEAPVKKKRKRPDLHAWSKDNKDKTEIDPKIINQLIAAASTPDELTDGQPAVKIVKLKDTKGRTRPPPTDPPTSPPTKPAPIKSAEPPAESSTELQEEAAHEEEVEEESRLKRMKKINRVKGQESVHDDQREHQHEDEKSRREEETMSHEDHRDTARDQHDDTSHEQDTHRHSHDDTHDDTPKRSSDDTRTSSASSDTEVHSAIPFEPVDEHIKEVLHWKENKESTKKQWTWDKENKEDERKKQKDDAAHDQTQTSTSKKRKDDTDDHSHDHIERRSQRDDDTRDETSRSRRDTDTETHDDTPRKTRHDEDDHDKPKSKATWEWKDEKNPIKKENDKEPSRRQVETTPSIPKPTSKPKAKATPVPKTGHDAVDRLVANMAADFAAHLEAEKAAGHDVTHLTVGDTNHASSKSDKPYVPPIHHDNLAHHDYVDPDKVQFADSIVKWHAPAAPPAIKVVDETAIEREADGTVHLRGAKPPAEGGPAGIDLALP